MAIAPSASAVLITTGDGSGNTTSPTADPGFDHVGVINGLTGVYVGNGWVLTANHVGEAAITLGGVDYPPVPGSSFRFQNLDASLADLRAFKLVTRPPLAGVAITNNAPTINTLITVIGNGRNRGTPTTFSGLDGFEWGPGRALRWGTNRIGAVDQTSLDTQAFVVHFDDLPGQPGSQTEADIVTGDSGGGAFTGSGSSAELVGIMFARASYMGQPANTSIYGNLGFIADLFAYRNDILSIIGQPDCDDGLDEDGDGLTDYPEDPGCLSFYDSSEHQSFLICDNGLDDDGDGLFDWNDPGCTSTYDTSERGPLFECDNDLDDDGDFLTDFPDDDGCLGPTGLFEAPEPDAVTLLVTGLLGLGGLGSRRRNRDRAWGHRI